MSAQQSGLLHSVACGQRERRLASAPTFRENDIHTVPPARRQTDGLGIHMATPYASALAQPVRHAILPLTGELTARGRVAADPEA